MNKAEQARKRVLIAVLTRTSHKGLGSDKSLWPLCGAHCRTTGNPCRRKALANGRCKLHGGLSTGVKTEDGRRRISEAVSASNRRRWAAWREARGAVPPIAQDAGEGCSNIME